VLTKRDKEAKTNT